MSEKRIHLNNDQIPMEDDDLYSYQLSLLYKRSDQLEVHSELIINEALPKLKQTNTFLDVGAGNGFLTEKIAPFFKKVYCVEPNYKSFQLLTKKFKNIYNTTIEDFKCNIKFDFILCSHVLYYIKREFWISIIKKLFNLLNENGIIVVILQSKDGEMQKFFNKFASQIYKIDPSQFNTELQHNNFNTELKHFFITIKTESFDEFLEICYFLLLEKKEYLIKKRSQIEEYIITNFKKDNYYSMKQEIDAILIFKN